MNVIFSSQFRDSSGYASAARDYLRAIDLHIDNSKTNLNFKILSLEFESHSFISQKDEELIKKHHMSLENVETYINNDTLLIWHMPAGSILWGDQHLADNPKWKIFKKLINGCSKNIAMSVWETDKIPELWKSVYKKHKTKSVIVPSTWNKKIFSNAGFKVHLLPHVIKSKKENKIEKINNFRSNLDDRFVVFSMSQWNDRKGFDSLIKAFSMEFDENPEALLIIKTYVSSMNLQKFSFQQQLQYIGNQIKGIKNKIYNKKGNISNANINVICNVIKEENLCWLYSKSDVFCLATRGEGFGLTISEAVSNGVPVVVPNKGGHLDYLDKNSSFLFECYKQPYIGDPTYNYNMNWLETDVLSLRSKLRESYDLWKRKDGSLKKVAVEANNYLQNKNFDSKSIASTFFNIIEEETTKNFKSYKDKINFYSNDKKKISILKDSYAGKDCYILTCGPSLKTVPKEKLIEKLKDKPVIAIKQAYEYVPEIVDFHIFNANNFQTYDYKEDSTPVVLTSAGESELACVHNIWSNNQKYDIFTPILDDRNYNKTIAKSLEFDKYLFDQRFDRPWGPGMMTEVAIYLAVHLGVKSINTIGWDLESPNTVKSNHFYDKNNISLIRPADSMKKNEIIDNIKMSEELYNWLKTKDISLNICTKNSYVSKKIPRVML